MGSEMCIRDRRYCDRLVLLSRGRVLAEGPPDEVLSPESMESAFGVRAAMYRDPITGLPAISLIGPADERPSIAQGDTGRLRAGYDPIKEAPGGARPGGDS